MKKVISIALFGDGKGTGGDYAAYLPSFVLAHHNLFPVEEGWQLRLYTDDIVESRIMSLICQLHDAHLIKIAPMGVAIKTKSMLWRLSPIFDSDADVVFCRDIDCIPMPRDRAVCDTFISSEAVVGTCHDNWYHVGVMGGLCHFKSAAFKAVTGFKSLQDIYTFAKKSDREWSEHGTDQLVLNRIIDQHGGPSLLEHRYAGWQAGPNNHKAHSRGEYRCRSWSTPTPDIGKSKLSLELETQADLLANHLGSAGYDIERARVFWETHGDASITKLVRECERS